jgi:uncharacterized membrane protein
MTETPEKQTPADDKKPVGPFRRAVVRGLAMLLPPLLTIVILVWVFNTVVNYVLVPIEAGVRSVIVWSIKDVHDVVPPDASNKVMGSVRGEAAVLRFTHDDIVYVRLDNGSWIPKSIFDEVRRDPGAVTPVTPEAIYHRYAKLEYLPRYRVIPLFLAIFVLTLYLLGKFLAAGVGSIMWNQTERHVLQKLPVIRQVYSSVKQVTDFLFSERDIEYTRVVAVEWPRKGAWAVGFVTGEGMLEVGATANEPVVSVLIPNSPMPATGFTVMVRRSEVVDINLSIDQALQFVVSCGVVVPSQQQYSVADNTVVPATVTGAITNTPEDPPGQSRLPEDRAKSE